ncbi:ABC transporter permease [Paenibacillus typhae]|uniref:ABC transporter permease n=1 Tax=Paenibacillus typhae TaxID=1174501 RepID=UPI001C8D5CE3|nr:ABC-2 family transporter protein [Paenibacillus typhae]MBY0012813.1 ABC-2 family transporter protein [Paenibacillus typhae]
MKYLTLYGHFIRVYLKSKMEFKFPFVMEIIANIVMCIVFYLGMKMLFYRFDLINGWNFYEVMFLYSLNLLAASISGMFVWSPMIMLSSEVQLGTFDSLLTKPLSPLLYLIFKQFQHTFLGWVVVSLYILVQSVKGAGLHLNAVTVLSIITVVISGVLINSGFLIITGSLSFWVIKNVEIVGLFNNQESSSLRTVVDFPLTIYSKPIQIVFTFLLPYAFINFYPATIFFHKENSYLFNSNLGFWSPAVGVAIFLLSLFIWKTGLKRYNSTGS